MVSIIIPNYNGASYLRKCIESINKNKSICQGITVIVIDNGSTDGSLNIIDQYSDIRLIKLKENIGFSGAVNLGIKKFKSDYVILLNNDIEVETDWLENLIRCIQTKPNAISCSSYMIDYYHRDIIDDAGDYYTILGWAFKGGLGENRYVYEAHEEIFSSCAGAAIYRKDILDKIGYFDEDFFAYLEDVDLSFRALLYGYKSYFCKEAVVYHIGSASTGGKYNKIKAYLTARNSIYVIYKNMPTPLIVVNGVFILLGIIIKILFFIKIGYGTEFIKGTIDGCKKLNMFRDKRKEIMKNRKLSCWELEKALIKSTFMYLSYYLRKSVRSMR